MFCFMLKKQETQTRLEKVLTISMYLNKQLRGQHILKKHTFFPYIPRKVHALFENNPQRRRRSYF
jgi:hypothetical protein